MSATASPILMTRESLQTAIRHAAAHRSVGNKVWISDVARELCVSMAELAFFLGMARRLGWVAMSRCDLPYLFPGHPVEASEIQEGFVTWHFMHVD